LVLGGQVVHEVLVLVTVVVRAWLSLLCMFLFGFEKEQNVGLVNCVSAPVVVVVVVLYVLGGHLKHLDEVDGDL
jgi:hypothetical protein